MPVARGLDLTAFAAPDDPRLAPDYLAEQTRLGCIRPEWRFAWVGADGAVGARVAFWAPPGAAAPMLIDSVHADAAGTVGPVLAAALAALAALAVDTIDYVAIRAAGSARVRSPVTEPDALEAAGFALVAIQTRFEHTGPVAPTAVPDGVALSSVAELGYDVVTELFAASQVDSGDRGTRDRDPAHEVAGLRQLEHLPAWWELAIDRATGAPLGFVAPGRTGDGGHVIAMIGVAPSARGRGVGRCLLAAGTATLRRDAPTARIIADVDADNPAMLRTTAAVGYRPFAARAHYRFSRA